ncbi:MAG: PRC-barrel domain-containing protein [Hyphomicrobiales bacterium]|nr:PRC-barrel domain-containing protein [Hyphomicrobiales bacterium]
MFRWLTTLVGAALTIGLGSALAVAQEEGQARAAAPPPAETLIVEQPRGFMLSEDLVGMEVKGPDDTSIGSVHSLLFNQNDEIVGAVVAIGGFFGIGAKHVALSWDEFDVRPSEKVARINLTREQLEAAPSFRDRASIEAREEVERAQRAREKESGRLPQPGLTPRVPQPGLAQ